MKHLIRRFIGWLFLSIAIIANAFCQDNKTEVRLQRVEAIANMYAYARYFYPTKYAEDLNWYKFLTHVIRLSDTLQDEESFDEFLEAQFSPLIPEMKIRLYSDTSSYSTGDMLIREEVLYQGALWFWTEGNGKKISLSFKSGKEKYLGDIP